MEVIRHQYICVQRASKTLGQFFEMIQEETIVVLGKEAGLPVVSALDDVHRQSGS